MSTGTQSQFREVTREIPPETRTDLLRQIRPRIVEKYQKEIPHPTQQLFMLQQGREAMYGGAAGGGKFQSSTTLTSIVYDEGMEPHKNDESKVCTPFGFKRLADIKVGDQVSNPDGTIARVIQVHEQGVQDIYRLTFIDGATCVAGADHKWLAHLSGKKLKAQRKMPTVNGWSDYVSNDTVMTTLQLKEHLDKAMKMPPGGGSRTGNGGVRAAWPLIPLTEPVQFTVSSRNASARWPVDPYIVGVLLGDGSVSGRSKDQVTYTGMDPQIAQIIRDRVPGAVVDNNPESDSGKHWIIRVPGIGHALNDIGMSGCRAWEKFVPERYKVVPLEMRWALVQGLMDTDGYVDNRGHCSFLSTSEQLAKDVQWLTRSLGFKATITGPKTKTYTYLGEKKQGRPCWNVTIVGDRTRELFGIDRKRDRCRDGINGGYGARRRVTKIEKIGRATARCITVDHPNGLYITDDFIVTHNSSALLSAALQYVDVPGYSALLLRRTWPDLSLPGAIMDRAKTWLMDTDAQSREGGRRWIFPSGAQLVFGYLSRDNDKYRYASAEFQFCVAPSTLVRMGDGSLTPIRDIVAGDSVMTLQGPRKVLKTHDVGIKPAVNLLTARGPATVSTHHPVLTPDGWLTPAELMTATGEYHFTAIVGGHIGSGVPAYQFPHPYTGLPRTINTTAQQHKVKIMLTSPERMLDLTVEDGSHYVLWNGIVAKNCGFDELTQFPQSTYEYLFSRLRRPALVCVRCQNAVRRSTTDRTYWEHAAPSNCRECKPDPKMLYKYGEAPDGMTLFDVPLRMRSATNPASNWVRDRFVDPQTRRPGALFIPSTLTDNPSLDQETYRESLSHLSPVDRERLLNGDWDVEEEGEYFQRNWFNVLRERPTDPRIRWCRYWDLAATSDGDWSAGCLIGLTPDGQWVIADMQRTQSTPREVERLVYQTAVQDGFGVPVWMEQEPGSSGVTVIDHYRRNVLVGYEFRADKKTGSKELRAKPLSAAVEAGNVSIVVGLWNRAFLDEMALYPRGINDDQCDSATGGFHVLSTTRRSRILA